MRRLISVSFLLIFSCFYLNSGLNSFADDFFDVDYDFIDHAFEGIKPVTNEQFDKTINQLTPQPLDNSFKGKLKTLLFGRKYGVEPPPKGQDKNFDTGGEQKAIADLKNGVYYIKLVVSIVGADGNVIQAGNYKIQQQKKDNSNLLIFTQGEKQYGYLKLKDFEDNLKEDDSLTYSRIDIINDDIVRVVYATLDSTKCAYAKVFKQS